MSARGNRARFVCSEYGDIKDTCSYRNNLWPFGKEDDDDESMYMMHAREKPWIRIVLIGRTGSGKSSTANTILGNDYFESRRSSEPVTSACSREAHLRFEKDVYVVDTPGMFDTTMKHEDRIHEIARCIHISIPGPHVFFIVIAVWRSIEEERNTIEKFVDTFSEKALDYSVVVFTGRDKLEAEEMDVAEYVETLPQSMKTILRKCGNRYIAVNNTADRDTKEYYAEHLLRMVERLLKENMGLCFTSDLYKAAEREPERQKKRQSETQQGPFYHLANRFSSFFDSLCDEINKKF